MLPRRVAPAEEEKPPAASRSSAGCAPAALMMAAAVAAAASCCCFFFLEESFLLKLSRKLEAKAGSEGIYITRTARPVFFSLFFFFTSSWACLARWENCLAAP